MTKQELERSRKLMKGDNLKKNSCMRDTVERERENGMEDTHKMTLGYSGSI